MGDTNQLEWVRRCRDLIHEPVIEVGSRHYDASTAVPYRSVCEGLRYVGVDLSAGENVDRVVDFAAPFERVHEALEGETFSTMICASVLEHVHDPFAAARNMSRVLRPGGTLFLSVPFAWRFHGYPNDYWRFTPAGVRKLFPDVVFDESRSTISSNAVGDLAPLPKDVNEFAVEGRSRSRLARLWRRLRGPGTAPPYLLRPTCVNLVGMKR